MDLVIQNLANSKRILDTEKDAEISGKWQKLKIRRAQTPRKIEIGGGTKQLLIPKDPMI